jgi:TRAP-type C4-dicarboxylate transport system permease small subunit
MAHALAAFERVAGGILAFVTALTFLSVICRYLFRWPIPDSFDVGRLLIGAVVFWGIAAASRGDDHIQIDILWTALGRRWRRRLDAFASSVTLAVFAVIAWMGLEKLDQTIRAGEQTFDLRLPLWPFYALCWAGMVAAVLLIAMRLLRGSADGPPPAPLSDVRP